MIEKMYEDLKGRRRDSGGGYDEVILMGYLVGSFIVVEIFYWYLRDGNVCVLGLKIVYGFFFFLIVIYFVFFFSGRVFIFLMGYIFLLEWYVYVLV